MIEKCPVSAAGAGVSVELSADLADSLGVRPGDTLTGIRLNDSQLLLTASDPDFNAQVEAARQSSSHFRNAVRALGT
ncbi:MAG: hypothetical protein JJU26_13110 [Oceanicaulis sp.]|uniref:hypothetical protein n=1 Tax=Glycocaulis sp. TaxID=1969725 RepID=UPI0025BE5802|nr:hypothetical protein [Glycocaulis sp.]MCC5982645.1 hypothetical protein [Oceanicaulis sp.]MCH8522352.1 hypothetical protein [Glycocaulis sp.]